MSDFDSSLPVRTENAGDVIAKLADATTPSQQLAIDAAGLIGSKMYDAAGTGLTSQANGGQQALDVGINVAGVQIDPRQIRALTNADVVTVEQGTSPWVVSGTVAATQSGTWTVGLSEDHNYGAVGSNTLRAAAQIGNATGAADFNNGATGAQTLRTAANLAVAGANVTALNPVPVSIVDAVAGSTEVLDFKQAVAVAAAASDTHTYTITSGKSLVLQKIAASGSGKIKVEILLGTIGGETLKVVLFNSTANPNVEYAFGTPQRMPDTQDVKVTITNLDKQAQDLYSTIEGYEV